MTVVFVIPSLGDLEFNTMGCASSNNYPSDIFTTDHVGDENQAFTTGNVKSSPPRTDKRNNNHSGDVTSSNDVTGQHVLRGDVTQKYQAKRERQEKLRDKQKKVAVAAESLATRVMEERETLSLTSRSRGTSRATSRTASPTGTRKQLTYRPQISEEHPANHTDNSQQQQQPHQPQQQQPQQPHLNGEASRLNS